MFVWFSWMLVSLCATEQGAPREGLQDSSYERETFTYLSTSKFKWLTISEF